ncbi:hypothetical protein Zm00014a_043875 [Zea mays]|uniref:Uncharacterized protein n=1 Tax=Zea mays TaxID=4577 RepID=A0A3L6F9X1_MAIZE|nr:hypothetical protein Zm00014a_043875 [Zea mays]
MAPHNIWQLPTLNSVVALVFAGKDLILLAKTGPERTDAFTLPIPQELLNNRQAEQAFFNYMLSPMREGLIALVQTGPGRRALHATHFAGAAQQPPGRAVFLRLLALANDVGLICQSITSFRGDISISNLECTWLLIRELVIQIVDQFEVLRSTIGLRYSVESVIDAIVEENVYMNSFLVVNVGMWQIVTH